MLRELWRRWLKATPGETPEWLALADQAEQIGWLVAENRVLRQAERERTMVELQTARQEVADLRLEVEAALESQAAQPAPTRDP